MAEDAELLAAWRAGDKSAGTSLFRRHFSAMRGYFANKVAPDDVEDLVQKTFVRLVESRDRFRGDASVRTYLFAIARNEFRMYLRKRSRRPDIDTGVSSLLESGISPSGIVARGELHAILLECLRRLSIDDQELVEMHYWGGLAPAEIAKIVESPASTIRVRLHRARGKLMELVESRTQANPEIVEAALKKTVP